MKRQLRVITITMVITCFATLTELDSSITECKTPQYSEEGLPTWLLLPVPISLREEKSFVYVKRLPLARTGDSNEHDVLVLDGPWNESKNDVDITLHKDSVGSYAYGGFYDDNTLLLVITKMSASHEGTYETETNVQDPSKRKSFCNLTMTPTPAVPDPGTVPVTVEKPSTSVSDGFIIKVLALVVAALVGIMTVFVVIIWKLIPWDTIHKKREEDKGSNTEDITMGEGSRENDTGEAVDRTEDSGICGEIELHPCPSHQASGGANQSSSLDGLQTEGELREIVALRDDASVETDQLINHAGPSRATVRRPNQRARPERMQRSPVHESTV